MGFWNDLRQRIAPSRTADSFDVEEAGPALPKTANKRFTKLPAGAREESPTIDFKRIDQAFAEESYVMQAITRYVELIFKADWKITSKDTKALQYVNSRIEEIGEAMEQPFDLFLIELATNIVKYHNCMFYKLKDRNRLTSLYVMDTPNVKLFVNDNLQPMVFRQYSESQMAYRDFPAKHTSHITYNRPSGRFFGIPFMLPVLDDIRILRQMESSLIKTIHKNIEPLVQHILGSDERPTTNDEIEMVQEAVENLPMDGQLVTSHRHQIKVHGAQNESLQIEKYLRYFEQRVMTGLGMPETAFGRAATSNKSTAEQLAKELHDRVKSYQKILSIAVNSKIIKEILSEPGAPKATEKVCLVFNEIDMDYLIKKENHAIFKFVQNATTEDEMRIELGLEKVKESDRKKLFGNLYQKAPATGDASNRNEPQNQHGGAQEHLDILTSEQDGDEAALSEAERRQRIGFGLRGAYEAAWSDVGFGSKLSEAFVENAKAALGSVGLSDEERSYFIGAATRLGQVLIETEVTNGEDAKRVFLLGQYLLSRVIGSRSLPPQLS